MLRSLRDSIYLYGLHDPGGEGVMLDLEVPGWLLFTEGIGYNPQDTQGRDYSGYSDKGLGVMVRLNAGYAGTGTLPFEQYYSDFARRCANFVKASPGAHIWIVGNETNHPIEWPGAVWDWNAQPPKPVSADKRGEPITPDRYARCYKLVRSAIKALSGHADDQVLVAAAAPWNALLTYSGNPNGDWVQYFQDILKLLSPDTCDGLTLHTYTHGTDPALIRSEAMMQAPFQNRHFNFRAYKDFMAAIPSNLSGLPVYITETDQGDEPWRNDNTGWVRQAYDEINAWNLATTQKIRSLLLYRWPNVSGDRWGIEGKQGVIADLRQALALRYRWEVEVAPEAEMEAQITQLEQQVKALQPQVDQVATMSAAAEALQKTTGELAKGVNAIQPQALRDQYSALDAEVTALAAKIPAVPTTGVPQPAMDDVRGKLATGPGTPYPTRDLTTIKRVIVHHTATRGDITPQRLAEAQVAQGKPGTTYHFLVNDDGSIHWLQPLETAVAQTNRADANADGIALALAGNFGQVPPGDVQLSAAAQVIAWLLDRFGLKTTDVYGRRELENVASPGAQWDTGAKYKDPLLAKVQSILEAAKDPYLVIQDLRKQVADLQSQVSSLAPQVAQLRQQVQTQESTIQAQRAEIARLQDQLRGSTGGQISKPIIVDKVDTLDHHPTLPPYNKRTKPVSMLVVHHTDTQTTTTVEQLAHYHVYGERRSADGTLLKAQWPGLGYHFVIGADGVIYQGQRETTSSYHVGGEPNNYSIGISLIGRFMSTDLKGQPQAADKQVPTPEQLRSTAHLAAWLMQEYDVPLEKVMGHRDVWPKSTSCPGEHWKGGQRWYDLLVKEIKAVAQGTPTGTRMEHYLLFWDHGTDWAKDDWKSAQNYIAHFRPTTGFTTDDALFARHVTIVGGYAGVSSEDEVLLRAAGCDVQRLNGANEAGTAAMLDALVAKDTPWPTTPPAPKAAAFAAAAAISPPGETPILDEWTVPDLAVPPPQEPTVELGDSVQMKVLVPPPTGPAEGSG